MRKIIDQTLEVPIGRKDGAVVPSIVKMHHLVDEDGMFPTMMAILCINIELRILFVYHMNKNLV